MTTKISQAQWVRRQLLTRGTVSRNQALRRYFSRLGARIWELRDEGWEIAGEWKKTKAGKDYEYRLVSLPQEV
jgi:hypothetical protein